MSRASARVFDFLQGAAFYEDLHRQAVALLPPGHGRDWFDVGCGPGLLARLAAARGYRVRGFDRDAAMIRRARRRAAGGDIIFVEQGLEALATGTARADVVSAASLLAVLDDRLRALRQLLHCLRPEGTLLLIEPTSALTLAAARGRLRHGDLSPRAPMLLAWAWARRHARAVDATDFSHASDYQVRSALLLDGMVAAWTLTRRPAAECRASTARGAAPCA